MLTSARPPRRGASLPAAGLPGVVVPDCRGPSTSEGHAGNGCLCMQGLAGSARPQVRCMLGVTFCPRSMSGVAVPGYRGLLGAPVHKRDACWEWLSLPAEHAGSCSYRRETPIHNRGACPRSMLGSVPTPRSTLGIVVPAAVAARRSRGRAWAGGDVLTGPGRWSRRRSGLHRYELGGVDRQK